MNAPSTQEILTRPGGKELYQSLKSSAWLSPFLEGEDPALRRLGAKLMMRELLDTLAPERAAAKQGEAAPGVEARRARREEGRKRASALWMAGLTFKDIGQWLRVTEQKARQWALKGREA